VSARCLECGQPVGFATGYDEVAAPTPGEVAPCVHCGAVMMFDRDLTVRGLTREEMDDVANNRELMTRLMRQASGIHMVPKL